MINLLEYGMYLILIISYCFPICDFLFYFFNNIFGAVGFNFDEV